jgi:RNA polymerase sigma factor
MRGERLLLVLWRKWFGSPARPAPPPESDAPEAWIEAIRQGDEQLRDELIRRYRPFIARTASRFCRRYVDPERDDEFSVALGAFDEAISRYAADSGSRFLGFAEQVMTRRLIDHVRKERKHAAAVPYSAMDAEEEDGGSSAAQAEAAQAMDAYDRSRAAEERRMEIAALTEELARFGITLAELVDQSPRHADSRSALMKIGRLLAADAALYRTLKETGRLPVKELSEHAGVSRKTIERHRKYLIAVALIAGGPYPYLRYYVQGERASEQDREEEKR